MKDTPWVKASKSAGNGGNCVEVRRHDGHVEVRDTKNRSKPAHVYTLAEWDAFLDGAKNGEFDHLLA
ncbi:DUF397 domain-containing protein [Actinoplanes sp. URMC 104]|uniref:DUF397 domain-containing protein n=1 Tax=Actinoplanes sp. URMC 104 TaxID=3423409 RepID=UPI003F1E2967